MSEENTEVNNDLETQLAEKDKMIEDLRTQFEAVKSKSDELLNETKKAKAKAREEAELAEQAKLEKAKKNGDFEQLLKSSEEQRKLAEEQLQNMRQSISKEKTKSESMRLAAELADGANAEILSEFISKRLKYTDDGLKVLDQDGNLTVSGVNDLKVEFENNEKFKALIRGNKSSGGGAVGDGGSASGGSTINRGRFEAMNAGQRMAFIQKGGKVTD